MYSKIFSGNISVILTLTGCVFTLRRISVSSNTALRCRPTTLYTCRRFTTIMVVCHVGQLYTSLRRWKFWIVVWENTNSVHFRAVWKNTAHVQLTRCTPKCSHLIPLTSAVFFNTPLKWTPFAYRTVLRFYVDPSSPTLAQPETTIRSAYCLWRHWENGERVRDYYITVAFNKIAPVDRLDWVICRTTLL